MKKEPVTVICRYTLKPGAEAEMLRLLGTHWPTLHRAGLVTDDPPLIFRGVAEPTEERKHGAGADVLVEIFNWKGEESAGLAHESPAVMAVWEPMGALCDAMEFPHFEKVEVALRR